MRGGLFDSLSFKDESFGQWFWSRCMTTLPPSMSGMGWLQNSSPNGVVAITAYKSYRARSLLSQSRSIIEGSDGDADSFPILWLTSIPRRRGGICSDCSSRHPPDAFRLSINVSQLANLFCFFRDQQCNLSRTWPSSWLVKTIQSILWNLWVEYEES